MKKYTLLCIIPLLSACATGASKKYDNFTGDTIYSTDPIHSRNSSPRDLSIQFRKYEHDNKVQSFDIFILVSSEIAGHLDVPAGKNLIVRLDGKDITLDTRGSGQKSTIPGFFAGRNIETIVFESLTPEQMGEIAKSKELKFRLKAVNEDLDFTIPISAVRALGPYVEYNAEYVLPRGIDLTPESDYRFQREN